MGSHTNVLFSSAVLGRNVVLILGSQSSVAFSNNPILYGVSSAFQFKVDDKSIDNLLFPFLDKFLSYDLSTWESSVSVTAHARAAQPV